MVEASGPGKGATSLVLGDEGTLIGVVGGGRMDAGWCLVPCGEPIGAVRVGVLCALVLVQ